MANQLPEPLLSVLEPIIAGACGLGVSDFEHRVPGPRFGTLDEHPGTPGSGRDSRAADYYTLFSGLSLPKER